MRATPKAEPTEHKPNGAIPPVDALDIAALWTDTGKDPLTEAHIFSVPIGRPKDFFRTVPDRAYRRKGELYVHKPENSLDTNFYIVDPEMQGHIAEARPCILVCVVDRTNRPRLWPLMLPRDGEHDNDAWATSREAARQAQTQWVRLIWRNRAFETRQAQPGYAPEPDFSKLPPFDDLVRTAFGERGIIRDETHPIYRELFGLPGLAGANDADPLL